MLFTRDYDFDIILFHTYRTRSTCVPEIIKIELRLTKVIAIIKWCCFFDSLCSLLV